MTEVASVAPGPCTLHIGLDHLAYNAFLGNWQTLAATAQRMRALVVGEHR